MAPRISSSVIKRVVAAGLQSSINGHKDMAYGMKYLLSFAVVISFCIAANKFAGPFDVLVKEPFVCENEGTKEIYFNESTVRKKTKQLFTLSLRAITAQPFDDNVQLEFNLAVWGNGGWRPNFLTVNYGPACTAFKSILPGIYDGFVKIYNITCPIPVGDYFLEDLDARPQVKMDTLPYNKYKVYMTMKKESVILGCLGVVADIVPKEKTKG